MTPMPDLAILASAALSAAIPMPVQAPHSMLVAAQLTCNTYYSPKHGESEAHRPLAAWYLGNVWTHNLSYIPLACSLESK